MRNDALRIVAAAVAAARAEGAVIPEAVARLSLEEMLDFAEQRALEVAVADGRESGPGIPQPEVERWIQSRLNGLMVRVAKLAAAKCGSPGAPARPPMSNASTRNLNRGTTRQDSERSMQSRMDG